MEDIASYYTNVEPSIYLLKETLRQKPRKDFLEIIRQKRNITDLDSFFLKDAVEFLRLSILNLLSYKFLMSGNFLAWGEVTNYYGAFYAINCLLRLKGFALVHIDYVEERVLRIKIERVQGTCEYKISQWKKGNPHQFLWGKFSEFYPELCTLDLGEIFIKERIRWNYDLYLPSQSMSHYAKKQARIRWENNFLDPNFGVFADPDAAIYYADLMADTGYHEAGLGDFIQQCIEHLNKIAERSNYKAYYVSFYEEIASGIEDFGSHPDTIREVQSWLRSSIANLEKI